jgi:hypothetical protein
MSSSVLRMVVVSALSLLACARGVGDSCRDGCVPGLPCPDCGDGMICATDFPGGYCIAPCTRVGERAECPEGSVCIETPMRSNRPLCASLCESDSDCRSGYNCKASARAELLACQVRLTP